MVLFQTLLRSRTQRQLVKERACTFLIKKFVSTTNIIFNLLHKTTNVTSNTSCCRHWLWAVERQLREKWRLVFRYLISGACGRKFCLHVLTLKLYVNTFLQITFFYLPDFLTSHPRRQEIRKTPVSKQLSAISYSLVISVYFSMECYKLTWHATYV